jgi:Flp pilus assembly protein TadG
MILIIILLLFAFYMFWRFEQRRKMRNAAHQSEKTGSPGQLTGMFKGAGTNGI